MSEATEVILATFFSVLLVVLFLAGQRGADLFKGD